ncbi:MAG TPA: hypothetical protein ACFYEI_03270 [Candidatus Tripitaka californicus]|uniref:hypothetical protein n=1 Tax=Candidatus Tripitaka californicus TaxID=3367616 RepID=UPI0040281ACC
MNSLLPTLYCLLLTVYCLLPALGGLVAQEQATAPAQEELQQAIELLQQGKVDEALPLLQRAVEKPWGAIQHRGHGQRGHRLL